MSETPRPDGFRQEIDPEPGAPVPPEQYESLFPGASKAFAEHVAETLQEGDGLERRPSLSWGRLFKQSALPVAGVAELSSQSGSILPPAMIGLGVISTTAIVAFNKRADRRAVPPVLNAALEHRRDVGQVYELYASKDKTAKALDGQSSKLCLVWYGPALDAGEVDTLAGNLKRMATLAKEQGIEHMAVESGAYANLPDSMKLPDEKKLRLDSIWENQLTRLGVISSQSQVVDTVDGWLARQEHTPNREVFDDLQTTAQALRLIRPSHPLLPVIEMYKDDPTMLQEQALPAVRQALARRLSRTELYADQARAAYLQTGIRSSRFAAEQEYGFLTNVMDESHWQTIASLYAPGTIDPVLETVPPQEALPHRTQVEWQTRLQGAVRQELPAAFDISDQEYTLLLESVASVVADETEITLEDLGLDRTKAEIAHEIALLRLIEDKIVPATRLPIAEAEGLRFTGYRPVTPFQEQPHNSDRVRKESLFILRLLRIASIIMPTCVLALSMLEGHKMVNDYRQQEIDRARYDITQNRHVTPDLVTVEEAAKLAHQRHPFLAPYVSLRHVRDTIDSFGWRDLIDPKSWLRHDGKSNKLDESAQSTAPAGTSSTATGVGDVNSGHEPDSTQFQLKTHGNIDASGFWPASTASTLSLIKNVNAPLTLEWIQNTDGPSIVTSIPTKLPDQYAKGSWIEVDRNLVNGDTIEQPLEYGPVDAVSLPIRSGTIPVAASIDGQETNIIRRLDNTYALQRSDGQDVAGKHLRYWVVPKKDAPSPRATRLINIGMTGTDINHKDMSGKAQDKLFKRLEALHSPDATVRAQAIATGKHANDQISNTWQYKYDPFSKAQEQSWKGLDDFIRDAEKNKAANCNIANTVAGLEDPESAQVIGFLNGAGSDNKVLSAHEFHQKRTDGDATPYTLSSDAINRPAGGNIIPDLPYAPIGGLAAAGLIAYRQRRRLAQSARRVLPKVAERIQERRLQKLQEYSDTELHTARVLTEQLLYSNSQQQTIGAMLLRRVGQLMTSSTEISQTPLTGVTSRRHLYSESAIQRVEALAAEQTATNPELAASAQQSATILRQVQKTQAVNFATTGRLGLKETVARPYNRAVSAVRTTASRLRGAIRVTS